MSAASFVRLLICCLPTLVVGAELAPPQHVSLISLNTNYTLTWDWPQDPAEGQAVTFTAQYVGKYRLKKKDPKWSTACEGTPRRSCDLTALGLHYLGIFMLRVRASAHGSHSDWVMTEFCPDKDAALGPPTKVRLAPAGGDLDVFISDPVTSSNSSMKELIPTLYYHILYWENSAHAQAQNVSKSANLVTLPSLKPWTWYCVKVQSRYDFYNKSSSFTSPVCLQTEGDTPWWQIFSYFVGSLILCFLVMLLTLCGSFLCYKAVKRTFFPSVQLPPLLRKDLDSDIPYLLPPGGESELLCAKVTVCEETTVLEIHNPIPESLLLSSSGLEPDSSRHSRQDSSSSGDSGVSTGCSSRLQPASSSSQSCRGAKDLGRSHFYPELVKMQEIALVTDEAIVV